MKHKTLSLFRKIKLNSIQSVIALSFTSVIIFSMLIISFALYTMFSRNAEERAASSTQQIMNQVNINLEAYLKGMVQISDTIGTNFEGDTAESKINISNLLEVTSKIRKDIVTMAVYKESGDMIISYPSGILNKNISVEEEDWFKSSFKNSIEYFFQPPHVQRIFEGRRPWVVSLCKANSSYTDSEKPENYLIMVDMNFSVIEQLCKDVTFGKTGYIYIIDSSGRIIYHPQQQLIYTGLKNENINDAVNRSPGSYFDKFQGKQRIMTVKNISYAGWKMVGISYVDELEENKRSFERYLLLIIIIGVIFEIGASIFISRKVSQPIKRLESQMKLVESGNFSIQLDVKGEDEVKKLSKSFNLMVMRIKQLMDEVILQQEEKRKSEFKALQAQINPHFLYNTLDSIIWMNENGKYEGVTTMVGALARFFRVSISKGKEFIRVGDEIEHAKSYLIIQNVRYKDRFEFFIEAEPDVLRYKTIKLILQPIIENAIYHGINKLQEKGEITIRVYTKEKRIIFSVSDNGYGISPSALKDILDKEAQSEHSFGVGLKNVNERIKLCYGNEYGIEITSELDVGTTVNITIPLIDD
ncbi:two-component system sensor histidine kinase YesM [Anaerobacterium chartisolvens]|uniref:histidine kinase n=1 Tax=Anaerobacterium chartisolvens TaxID=1297424 RepID=A0A369AZF8_9FIRM|nr:sensor histidine kinase [Anaerobacterium chartisolvens]RCX14820.1 two-component system sensor histidine kinase YesM [Anaerobacterium chartisolvens]